MTAQEISKRWRAYLRSTPGAGARIVAAIKNGDDDQVFQEMFRAALSDHGWDSVIARLNDKYRATAAR
jgi:hypothetical protein